MKGNIWKIIGAGAAALLVHGAARGMQTVGGYRERTGGDPFERRDVRRHRSAGRGQYEEPLRCAFRAAEGRKLTFGGSESQYGFYLTSLNGTEATDEYYWAVYTTLESLDETYILPHRSERWSMRTRRLPWLLTASPGFLLPKANCMRSSGQRSTRNGTKSGRLGRRTRPPRAPSCARFCWWRSSCSPLCPAWNWSRRFCWRSVICSGSGAAC